VVSKIASKVLANRLKKILLKIISKEQSAFESFDLSLIINVINAYECSHFVKKKKSKGKVHCAFKLDVKGI
jgi:hypothetical protein